MKSIISVYLISLAYGDIIKYVMNFLYMYDSSSFNVQLVDDNTMNYKLLVMLNVSRKENKKKFHNCLLKNEYWVSVDWRNSCLPPHQSVLYSSFQPTWLKKDKAFGSCFFIFIFSKCHSLHQCCNFLISCLHQFDIHHYFLLLCYVKRKRNKASFSVIANIFLRIGLRISLYEISRYNYKYDYMRYHDNLQDKFFNIFKKI